MLEVEFKEAFESSYLRIKKRSGHQVLCCFPNCCAKAGDETVNCPGPVKDGHPVECVVKGLETINDEKLFIVARFAEYDAENQMRKGMALKDAQKELLAQIMSQKDSFLRYHRPSFQEWNKDGSLTLRFNEEKFPWHYGWTSTNRTCNNDHCFEIEIYYREIDEFIFHGRLRGTRFKIFGRRRTQKRKTSESSTGSTSKRQITKTERVGTVDLDLSKENRVLDRLAHFLFQIANFDRQMKDRPIVNNVFAPFTSSKSAHPQQSPPPSSPSSSSHGTGKGNQHVYLEQQHQQNQNEEVLNTGLDGLELILKTHGKFSEERIDDVIKDLRRMGQCMTDLSPDNGFVSLVQKYGGPNLPMLKQQIKFEETLTNFEWTPEHEDEVFDETRFCELREPTIFAQGRQEFRSMVSRSLKHIDKSWVDFMEPMELAAKYGLFPDPFYPPPHSFAVYLHIQINGNTDLLETQDYGSKSRTFASVSQQNLFARDFMLVRRAVFRNMLFNQILLDLSISEVEYDLHQKPPTAPEYDLSGVWLNIDPWDEAQLVDVYCTIWGPQGTYSAKVFRECFSRLEIVMKSSTAIICFSSTALLRPKMHVELGKPAKSIQMPVPILGAFSEVIQTHQFGGFVSNDTGKPLLHLIFSTDHYGKLGKHGQSSFLHDFVEAGNPGLKHGKPKVCMFFTVDLNRQEQTFTLTHEHVVFPNPQDFPDMNDMEAVSTYFRNNAHNQTKSHFFKKFSTTFTRSFLDSTDTDILMQLF